MKPTAQRVRERLARAREILKDEFGKLGIGAPHDPK